MTKKLFVTTILLTSFCLFCVSSRLFANEDKLRVACIGDSLTRGNQLLWPETESYPCLLHAMLPDDWEVVNFGAAGTTILVHGEKPYIKEGILEKVLAYKPHIITIQLGINDTKPESWIHHEKLYDDLKMLVETLKSIAELKTIFLCYPPPAFTTKFNLQPELVHNAIIPTIDRVSKDTGVKIIDLYTPLLTRPDLYKDHVHLNPEGAKFVAGMLYHEITGRNFRGKTHKSKCRVIEL